MSGIGEPEGPQASTASTPAADAARSHEGRAVEERGLWRVRSDQAAAAAAASEEELMRHELYFEALQNAEYHSLREGFLTNVNRALTFLGVLTGTAAFAAVVGTFGDGWRAWIALGPVLAGGLSLVFNLSGRANQHSALRGRYQALASRIRAADPAELPRLRDEMWAIYPTEPPPYAAMQAVAYNAAVDRIYEEPQAGAARLSVPFVDRITGQFVRWRSRRYCPA